MHRVGIRCSIYLSFVFCNCPTLNMIGAWEGPCLTTNMHEHDEVLAQVSGPNGCCYLPCLYFQRFATWDESKIKNKTYDNWGLRPESEDKHKWKNQKCTLGWLLSQWLSNWSFQIGHCDIPWQLTNVMLEMCLLFLFWWDPVTRTHGDKG